MVFFLYLICILVTIMLGISCLYDILDDDIETSVRASNVVFLVLLVYSFINITNFAIDKNNQDIPKILTIKHDDNVVLEIKVDGGSELNKDFEVMGDTSRIFITTEDLESDE